MQSNKMIKLENKTILITGAAGFIGYHLSVRLLDLFTNVKIIGIDNLNNYYDVTLKQKRLENLSHFKNFTFVKGDIANKTTLETVFTTHKPHIAVNLAAQAGVRYSITNPEAYIHSNIIGFFNLLECCRHYPVEHLLFASSSSVYGSNTKVPYSTEDKVDKPVSLYAATKKSDELMAHAYSKLYNIPTTGLRFFTVYGPLGRPDMAYFGFTNKMVANKTIQIFNNGDLYRDFTYIDDIVSGLVKIMQKTPELTKENVTYKIYNIGNNKPESLMDFISILEKVLLKEHIISTPAKKEFLPMQAGDVYQTYADISDLEKDFNFRPKTTLQEGLSQFAKWYKNYYYKPGV